MIGWMCVFFFLKFCVSWPFFISFYIFFYDLMICFLIKYLFNTNILILYSLKQARQFFHVDNAKEFIWTEKCWMHISESPTKNTLKSTNVKNAQKRLLRPSPCTITNWFTVESGLIHVKYVGRRLDRKLLEMDTIR